VRTSSTKKRARHDFADFVLATYSYVVLLDSPWRFVTAESVADRFSDGEYAVDDRIDAWLQENLDHEEYGAICDIVDAGAEFEAMVGELFGIGGSDLDRLRVRRWFDRHSPRAVLHLLGRGQIGNISSRVRFSRGPKLRMLANTAYDTRSALDELENRYQRDVVDDVTANLAGVRSKTCETQSQAGHVRRESGSDGAAQTIRAAGPDIARRDDDCGGSRIGRLRARDVQVHPGGSCERQDRECDALRTVPGRATRYR